MATPPPDLDLRATSAAHFLNPFPPPDEALTRTADLTEVETPPPGRLGRYHLRGELGRGGMGAVLRGYDPALDRELAVKVLLSGAAADPTARRRFEEEARIGGRLQHPGVVPVHELGVAADGRPFFTMKLIEGRTLAALLKERPGPAHDLPRLLTVFEQVCQTVAFAHSKGVLHRDLKPANVMVGAFGEVQVMDWGVAKVLVGPSPERERRGDLPVAHAPGSDRNAPGSPAVSQTGSLLGTPAYMSPEQARGEVSQINERADVFGLGAILCEILTGEPPFLGNSSLEVQWRASLGDLDGARERLGRCPADPELVDLARQCLAPGAADRPAEAVEVARRIAGHRAGVAERLRLAELARATAEATAAGERRRRRLTLALAAAVLTLAVGGATAAAWVWQRRAALTHDVEKNLAVAEERAAAGDWPAASEALARAEGRLTDADLGGLRLRVAAARADLTDRVERDRKDRALTARLDAIRIDSYAILDGKIERSAADRAYAEAFRSCGLGPETEAPEATAAKVRASAVRPALLTALDDWAQIKREDDPARARLLAAAQQADDDPTRRRLRDLAARGERGELEQFARRPDWHDEPADTLLLLDEALLRAGAADAGRDLLVRIQRRHRDDFRVNFELANLLLRTRRPVESVGFYRAALAARPDNPAVLNNLGVALYRVGDWDGSVEALTRTVELRPNFPEALTALGITRDTQRRPAEAVALYRRALAQRPRAPEITVNLGLALRNLWDLDAAAEVLTDTLAVKPDFAAAVYNLGNVRMHQRNYAEAERLYRRALALQADLANAHMHLGAVLQWQGRYAEAAAEYRWVIGYLPPGDGRRSFVEPLVRDAERMGRLAPRLAEFLAGAVPEGPAEGLDAGRVALAFDHTAAAARLMTAALTARPDLSREPIDCIRTDAARAAARAADGRGQDAAGLPDRERASLCRQALGHLRTTLAALPPPGPWTPHYRGQVQEVVGRWLTDPDLESVRGERLSALPESERAEWQAFWSEATNLRVVASTFEE
jgi:serine/threonine-protein kinase